MGGQLSDKIVLITGAAGGVGRVVATEMAAQGAKTVLLADIAPEPLGELAAAIEAAEGSAKPIAADLSSAEGCAELVGRVGAEQGRLDVLVHTAAVPSSPVDFLSVPDETWASEIALHLNASFYLGRGFAALMARTGGGSLLYTGSIATQGGSRGMAGYTASKTGLLDRIATPKDVATAFVFLASDNAGYITGHNLVVDGGTSVWMRTPND